MARDNIKSTAIIYTGYHYQTLQGIRFLIEWLMAPSKYKRIRFEADYDSEETPEGIDDIVCERADSKIDYYQVKYTPSPDTPANQITWDWLLKKAGTTARSRTLVQKLSDAIHKASPKHLGSATLITNKYPSREVEECIQGEHINYDLIPPEIRTELDKQLGSEAKSRTFCKILKINHSDKNYLNLNNQIFTSLSTITDEAGIYRLLYEAGEWAKFKQTPAPDGWITLQNIRSVISTKRPEPILQSFYIPDNYIPPNTEFHTSFLNEILDSNEKIHTLSGAPGIGKSTYLSFLCNVFEREGIPFVRHHYFLSVDDRTLDRLSPKAVLDSFNTQIERYHSDAGAEISYDHPENFHRTLEDCAKYYRQKSKKFMVVIDGLDHVWRDNDRDKSPLDEVFKMFIPVCENMVLIIGTQPVDDRMLPARLIDNCPRTQWKSLPAMSGNSIFNYLNDQINNKRLFLQCAEGEIENEISKSATALLGVTHGYPLHVIYSCESLVTHDLSASSWQIERLPACEGGNIANYYNSLWRGLNARQRDILHLCCEFSFHWPRPVFAKLLADSIDEQPSIYAVAHLLNDCISGLRPFHESLIVYVNAIEEHAERIQTLLPAVCSWLETDAPEALRERWLWSCYARSGDSQPLRDGLTRDWVLDRLVHGYSAETFIHLLSQAESIAFNELQYAEAYRFRALKTRLLDGPEFQIPDINPLKIVSLNSAQKSVVHELISSRHDLSVDQLSIIAISLWHRGDESNAILMAELALKRHRAEDRLYSSRDNEQYLSTTNLVIRATALTKVIDVDKICTNNFIEDWPESFLQSLIFAYVRLSDLATLIQIHNSTKSIVFREQLEISVIRLALIEGVEITAWTEFDDFKESTISNLIRFLSMNSDLSSEVITYEEDGLGFLKNIEVSYDSWFFEEFSIRFSAIGDYCRIPVQSTGGNVTKSVLLNMLSYLVDVVFEDYKDGVLPSFDILVLMLDDLTFPKPAEHEQTREIILFKNAWVDISIDLHLIFQKQKVNAQQLELVIRSENFNVAGFLERYSEHGLLMLTDDAIEFLLKVEQERQCTLVHETNEYTSTYLNLAEIALKHGSDDWIKLSTRYCWDFILGYGWRKDGGILDLLTSIEYLSEKCPASASDYLHAIAPQVVHVTDYTDGKGTRHALPALTDLLAKLDVMCLASKYEQEIIDGEWYEAEYSLEKLLEILDSSSPLAVHLCKTGLSDTCLQVLDKRKSNGDVYSEQLLNSALEHNGYLETPPIKEESYSSSSSITEDRNEPINPADYPPEDFEVLIAALAQRFGTRNVLVEWYKYWVDQGAESRLIKIVWPYLKDKEIKYDDAKYLLDHLFSSYKKLRGKRAAFEVLVKAHQAKMGWQSHWESLNESLARLDIVANLYPERADEFIQKSAIQKLENYRGSSALIIPDKKMVYFLLKIDRLDEAKQLIEAMVGTLKEETRNLILKQPSWRWGALLDSNSLIAQIIVVRLQWPVSATKWWVAQQLAKILAIGQESKNVEQKLLNDLEARQLESECIEILVVFWLASQLGYKPHQPIGQYVLARSTLSDMLLNMIDPADRSRGEYATDFNPRYELYDRDDGFDKNLGVEFPKMYFSRLESLGSKHNLPLTDLFRHEWTRTFEYCGTGQGGVRHFLGNDQGITGQFYTRNSHRGRSAYLRAIHVAKQFFGMPLNYAQYYSVLALPIEPSYIRMHPTKPSWFIEWSHGEECSTESIIAYVTDIIRSCEGIETNHALGALSYPIVINENKMIDITCVRFILADGEDLVKDFEDRIFIYSLGEQLDELLDFEVSNHYRALATSSRPLVGTSVPLYRYGHWHAEVGSRGLYVPLVLKEDIKIIAEPSGNGLDFRLGKDVLGHTAYWNYSWDDTYPRSTKPNCGTYTLLNLPTLSTLTASGSSMNKQVIVCTAKVVSRKYSMGEYDCEQIEFQVAV